MDPSVTTMIVMLLPFVGAAFAPFLTSVAGHRAAYGLALAPGLMFLHFLRFVPAIASGDLITGGLAWVPSFNVSFSFAIDGLSLVFSLLITGIGTLILIYAGSYLKGHAHLGRFLSFLLMFLGSMLGLVLSDSFLMLFIFWELTSVTSFLLIGFDHARPAARRAAVQALVITGGGGLFLLAGLLVLWNVTGVTTFSLALMMGDDVRHSPWYLLILFLVLGGAFTKSAQFPFHMWLPNAMEAPTPVSAFLHSATMVKAGVYLLMRLNPILGDTPVWHTVLPIFGGATLVFGAVMGIRQTDLKQMLAYSTMASLGLLVMLTGYGSEHAIAAAVLYLIAHALFKGALFMLAGSVDHGAHTRDITQLSGLRKTMPLTFVLVALAALSMAGLPPLFGFLAKEEIYAALAGSHPRAWFFTGLAIVGNSLMFALAAVIALKPFLGKPSRAASKAHESGFALLIGPATLAVTGLTIALIARVFHLLISSPMVWAIEAKPHSVTVTLVPHPGVPLLLSVITIILGMVLYGFSNPLRYMLTKLDAELGWDLDRGFDVLLANLVLSAHRLSQMLQTGKLRTYVAALLLAIAAALFAPMLLAGEWPDLSKLVVDIRLTEAVVFAIASAGLVTVLFASSRLIAIVALGIQGFAVAMVFLLYSAPDLAYTQFMIETLSVVILTLVMTRLDLNLSDRRTRLARLLGGGLAAICGLGFTLVLLKATEAPFDPALTEFFNTWSKTIAHGANVVNVIIVDFRGTDTLGEIAVVLITGLAILGLVRLRGATPTRIAANDPAQSE